MNDTELIDALQALADEWTERHHVGQDVQLGALLFTIGTRENDLRKILQARLEQHIPRLVARSLTKKG